MAETLTIATGSKEAKYRELIPQVKSMLEGEDDLIANMANVASMIHETFGFLWTGFYRVKNDTAVPQHGASPLRNTAQGNDETSCGKEILILGPFQGPLACTRIRKGKGVCGTAWERGETIVVEDVDNFPGHIACSSDSRSEIVVPLKKDGVVVAVLDIDSAETGTFDDVDKYFLEELVAMF